MAEKPVKAFRIGSVTASVWKNEGGLSVTLVKQYKEGDEWKNTATLFHADVACALKALEHAEEYLSK